MSKDKNIDIVIGAFREQLPFMDAQHIHKIVTALKLERQAKEKRDAMVEHKVFIEAFTKALTAARAVILLEAARFNDEDLVLLESNLKQLLTSNRRNSNPLNLQEPILNMLSNHKIERSLRLEKWVLDYCESMLSVRGVPKVTSPAELAEGAVSELLKKNFILGQTYKARQREIKVRVKKIRTAKPSPVGDFKKIISVKGRMSK